MNCSGLKPGGDIGFLLLTPALRLGLTREKINWALARKKAE